MAAPLSLETAPPVVVKTSPTAGAIDVNPALTELRVIFSKPMQDGSWSWSTWGEENFPEMDGKPRYLPDGRTCVLPVKLEPDKFYATWLNSDKFKNFKDRDGRSAVPYLLTFTTTGGGMSNGSHTGRDFEHLVQPGDTLSKIVKIQHEKGARVSIEDILKANPGLNPSGLRVGQKIYIPASTASGMAGMTDPSPPTSVEDLPGHLTFHGRYQHRSRGSDIETPSELWLKETMDGGLLVMAHLPWMGTRELASGDGANRLTRYEINREASGDRPGYSTDLKLGSDKALLTRRGIRQDVDGQELPVPEGASFDPNTRPDPYCAANILLRAFALDPGETKEFRMYDWDNTGEALDDYTIQVSHAGKERIAVPAGTFEANHLILKQLTSADTWFKKRAGHTTDFWVLDNHVIVRVLRHREPYEMMLLDYTVPGKLDTSAGASTKEVQSWVETFFATNYRDITSRETLEWGNMETKPTGDLSIRYKYLAEIWGKETITNNQVFTFDPQGKFISVKEVYNSPKERMSALVDKFFANNYRDIKSRETIEWGEVETTATGNTSIRYKYRAKIWDKDAVTNNQVFTFAPEDQFVSITDVSGKAAADNSVPPLNADQRAVIAWTDRQFGSYFDDRTFDGWSDDETKTLETKCIDALSGPRSRDYYTAINTLGALRSTNGLARLREIAFEQVDGNNRNRWMSVRVLGILGDRQSIPDLIHLVYHGNQNTHWWAQIALVQLTGQNFGGDWEAWGKWWNESGGQPLYDPDIIRWWDGQAQTMEELKEVLAAGDANFLKDIRP